MTAPRTSPFQDEITALKRRLLEAEHALHTAAVLSDKQASCLNSALKSMEEHGFASHDFYDLVKQAGKSCSMISAGRKGRTALFRRDRRRLSSLFQHMLNGFIYCRALGPNDFTILEANGAFSKMVEIPLSRLAEASASSLFPDMAEDPDGVFSAMVRPAADGIPVEFEAYFPALNRWFIVSAFSTDKGYFAALFNDITLRRKLEDHLKSAVERAESATEAKDFFMAALSHDIRTAISIINSAAGILTLSDSAGNSAGSLKVIRAACSHLSLLIDEVLEAYTDRHQGLCVVPAPFRPREVLSSYMEVFASSAEAGGLRFSGTLSPDLPERLAGDLSKLGRVLFNLVGNGVKYTDAGSVEVDVRLEPEEQTASPDTAVLTFTVRDTGVGIAPEDREHVFESLYRGDTSSGKPADRRGTGLGLAVTERMVAAMNGRIELRSGSGGTTVRCVIPFQRCAEEEDARKSTKRRACSLLLVEDNAVNAQLSSALLRASGHSVETAFNGEEAVRFLAAESFDAVLMDLHLPDVSGLEIAAGIRSGSIPALNSAVPVIAFTAHVLPDIVDKVRAAGMNGFISKPFEIEDLLDIIERGVADAGNPSVRFLDYSGSGLREPENPALVRTALDISGLQEQFPDNARAVFRVLEHFTRGHAESLRTLERRLREQDASEVQRAAHYIKTSYSTIHARSSADIARRIEEAARENDLELGLALLSELKAEADRCISAVDDFLGGNTES